MKTQNRLAPLCVVAFAACAAPEKDEDTGDSGGTPVDSDNYPLDGLFVSATQCGDLQTVMFDAGGNWAIDLNYSGEIVERAFSARGSVEELWNITPEATAIPSLVVVRGAALPAAYCQDPAQVGWRMDQQFVTVTATVRLSVTYTEVATDQWSADYAFEVANGSFRDNLTGDTAQLASFLYEGPMGPAYDRVIEPEE